MCASSSAAVRPRSAPASSPSTRCPTRSAPPGSTSTTSTTTPSPTCSTPPGSTRIPTGVQITHLNLATNVVQVIEALEGEEGDRGVSWLPFFHDMGLITALLPPMIGHYFTFMTPAAFVRRPGRWIREMARKPGDTGGIISVAPNFAFDHAAARGLPKDGEEPLDLSNVKAVLNGSEPISAATVRRFNEAFGPYGFQPQGDQAVLRPGRGHAVRVDHPVGRRARRSSRRPRRSSTPTGSSRCPTTRRRPSPRPARARSASPSGRSSSTPRPPPSCPTARSARSGSAARTWAPATGTSPRRPSRRSRTSSSRGPTRRTPKARPTTRPGCAPATTAPSTTASSTSPAASRIWSSSTAATTTRRTWSTPRRSPPRRCAPASSRRSRCRPTSCPTRCSTNAHAGLKRDPDDTSEQLVIVAERAAGSHKLDLGPIADDIRAAIAVRHGVTVRDVLLTPAGAIPRTSSGKIGRRACRVGLPGRQPAQREGRQRLPRRDGLTTDRSS